MGDGVTVAGSRATRNTISENRISSNDGLGIDLDDDGVTANDLGDGDGGGQLPPNFPVNLQVGADGTTITGTLNSRPNTNYRIELFGNSAGVACDPSGNGEGEEYLTAMDVATDGSGNATFSVPLSKALPAGHFVTATATDGAGSAFPGNTSEFSQCATPPGEIVVESRPSLTALADVRILGRDYGHACRRADRSEKGRSRRIYGLGSGSRWVGYLGDSLRRPDRRQHRIGRPGRPRRERVRDVPGGRRRDRDLRVHQHEAGAGQSRQDGRTRNPHPRPVVPVRAPPGGVDDECRHDPRNRERHCGQRGSDRLCDNAHPRCDLRALRGRDARLDDDPRAALLCRLQPKRRQQHRLHRFHRRAGRDEESSL